MQGFHPSGRRGDTTTDPDPPVPGHFTFILIRCARGGWSNRKSQKPGGGGSQAAGASMCEDIGPSLAALPSPSPGRAGQPPGLSTSSGSRVVGLGPHARPRQGGPGSNRTDWGEDEFILQSWSLERLGRHCQWRICLKKIGTSVRLCSFPLPVDVRRPLHECSERDLWDAGKTHRIMFGIGAKNSFKAFAKRPPPVRAERKRGKTVGTRLSFYTFPPPAVSTQTLHPRGKGPTIGTQSTFR